MNGGRANSRSANSSSASGPATPARGPGEDAAWARLLEAATAPYRSAGRFSWHFARGKLGRDPAFRALVEGGQLAGRRRVVDIGCGQGLLASLLQACSALQRAGGWPTAWPAAPAASAYTGIELMQRDVHRALAAQTAQTAKAAQATQAAPAHGLLAPVFVCADMRDAALPPCDLVVILDVLHYVDHAAQAAVLRKVRAALQPGGRLLLRVGDAASTRGFAVSQWVDRAVTLVRGHRVAPTWGRTVPDWQALLNGLGFASQALPMSRGTPFANVLLVADVQGTAA